MKLGNKLLTLRKQKGLSQEEVADILGVSRQTISKWETDQSTPDFDKIIPLCDLYEITTDELLKGKKEENGFTPSDEPITGEVNTRKRAKFIGIGIFLYFISVAAFMLIPLGWAEPVVITAVFLLICGLATSIIIYGNLVYKKTRTTVIKESYNKTQRTVFTIVNLLATVIYFWVSFVTFAWHITWIIWIIDAIVLEIFKLIFTLTEAKNEK